MLFHINSLTMKTTILTVLLSLCIAASLPAQQMHVKQHNFNTFYEDQKVVPPLLLDNSSRNALTHPEFGVLPFNAQCSECVELIDKRTANTRLFIDPKDAGHSWSQSSYFPLHYKKSENDIWRTIDFRLKPNPATAGVYEANNQPVPTKCDLNRRSTTLDLEEILFEFNRNLSMYFFDEQTVYTAKEPGNYTNYTIGQEGLLVKNMWNGMDMQQIFRTGEIKTNYVINAPLQLPITKGWMVIEDHFTLPEGYVFEESKEGRQMSAEKFQGDYLLKNREGKVLAMYEKPVYVDAKAWGQHGEYKLIKNGNDYTLQMFVPVDWLTRADNTYPLLIDPTVSGTTRLGSFRASGGVTANMAFSTKPSTCNYVRSVFVPGKSKLTNAYADLEYQLTYDNTCGTPPLPTPYCTFSQATMEVVSEDCGTTSGKLSCNPASPPYTGTCTTDPMLVPNARSIKINSFVPNYLSCLTPKCADHVLTFTLRNQDSICGNICGFLCARGNIWQMTIEAERVKGFITSDSTQICYGHPVTFIAHPEFGVPAYKYEWLYGNQTIITSDSVLTFYPGQSDFMSCKIIDSCGEISITNSLPISVTYVNPTPSLVVSGDTLLSSSPSNNQWYRNDSAIVGAVGQFYLITQPGQYYIRTIDQNNCQSEKSNTYTRGGSVGLTDISTNKFVSLHPNPATNELIIQANNFYPSLITIYDINGRKVKEEKYAPRIDISAVNAGVYFIEVRGDGSRVMRRFVKM